MSLAASQLRPWLVVCAAAVLVLGVGYIVLGIAFPVRELDIHPLDDLPAGFREVFKRSTTSGNSQEYKRVELVYSSTEPETASSMRTRLFAQLRRSGWDVDSTSTASNAEGACVFVQPLADYVAQTPDDDLQELSHSVDALLYVSVTLC